jgi:hypothetical protein
MAVGGDQVPLVELDRGVGLQATRDLLERAEGGQIQAADQLRVGEALELFRELNEQWAGEIEALFLGVVPQKEMPFTISKPHVLSRKGGENLLQSPRYLGRSGRIGFGGQEGIL